MKKTPLRRHQPSFRVLKGLSHRRTPLKVEGQSTTAELKRSIQSLLRQIVIKRDDDCILRGIRHCQDTVLQADHLISRSNAATYGDSRLVVCVCRSCHAWKSLGGNRNKAQYDALVRTLLPPTRVALWDASEKESWQPHPMREYDWRMVEIGLRAELRGMMNA